MITMKDALLAATLCLLGASPAISENSEGDIWAECRATDSCTIEYDHLANQDTDPFLFIGKVVDREHPKWRSYRKALRRYPDVRDCLVEEERDKSEPNLLMIDWERIGTGKNASVCVFRIASSLGSVERIQAWLAYHRFKFGSVSRRVSESFIPHYETYPVYNITASWSADRYREFNPSWLVAITGYDLIYSYTLVLNFDQNQRIAGVGVGTRSKLN